MVPDRTPALREQARARCGPRGRCAGPGRSPPATRLHLTTNTVANCSLVRIRTPSSPGSTRPARPGQPKPVRADLRQLRGQRAYANAREPRSRTRRSLAVLHAALPRRRAVDPHALDSSTPRPKPSFTTASTSPARHPRARGGGGTSRLVSLVATQLASSARCRPGSARPAARGTHRRRPRVERRLPWAQEAVRRTCLPDLRHDRDHCSQIWTVGASAPRGRDRHDAPEGELLIRGPMVAPGAIANDGWLHTGDRGSIYRARRHAACGGPDRRHHRHGRRERLGNAGRSRRRCSHIPGEDAARGGGSDAEWGRASGVVR